MDKDKEMLRRRHVGKIAALKVALNAYRTDDRSMELVDRMFNLLIEYRNR